MVNQHISHRANIAGSTPMLVDSTSINAIGLKPAIANPISLSWDVPRSLTSEDKEALEILEAQWSPGPTDETVSVDLDLPGELERPEHPAVPDSDTGVPLEESLRLYDVNYRLDLHLHSGEFFEPEQRLLVTLKKDMLPVDAPTHIYEVFQPDSDRSRFFTAHWMVYATQCAFLPPIPSTTLHSDAEQVNEGDDENGPTFALPVIPLCVPNLETFVYIELYLYLHDLKDLFYFFTKFHGDNYLQVNVHEISDEIVREQPACYIIDRLSKLYGFWRNVCKLGIFDEKLWAVMQLSWKVLTTALEKTHEIESSNHFGNQEA